MDESTKLLGKAETRRMDGSGLHKKLGGGGGTVAIMGAVNGKRVTIEKFVAMKEGANPGNEILDNLHDIIFGKKISTLLAFIPFAILSHTNEWGPVLVFWCNFFAMIPLAMILGDFTEELALHTSQVVGGLLNATFGNAVEMMIAIQALRSDQFRVVQASMLGSIFSTLLLVLGCCLFFGGIYHKEQTFNTTAAVANVSLLALASTALVLPTPYAAYYDISDEDVLVISRVASIFLMLMYGQLLIFQLKTHSYLFEDEDDDEETAFPSVWIPFAGLAICTAMIAVFSEWIVDSIDGFVEASGVSKSFVGLIILPFVGNAVDYIVAVQVAIKNKLNLSLAIAIGGSTQVSLFVIPGIVLIGWGMDKDMTLNFPHFEVISFVMAVLIVSITLGNPNSNWLRGSLMLTTYCLFGIGYLFEKTQEYH